MANRLLMEQLHLVKGIDPVADVFDTTQYSDVVDMAACNRGLFIVHVGVGATGTSTFTVQACDDTTPSNRTAIPFYYREILSGDTEGTITLATATGFTNTAGSSKIIAIEVRADQLAATGYRYVQLKSAESVNSPVLGSVLFIGEAIAARAVKESIID